MKTPDDDHVMRGWFKFLRDHGDAHESDPLHIVIDPTKYKHLDDLSERYRSIHAQPSADDVAPPIGWADAVARAYLEAIERLDESIQKVRSEMNHPTYRVPQTRDEALWEQELKDVPR